MTTAYSSSGLRILGVGRNRYIDLMNESKASRSFLRRVSALSSPPTTVPRDLLPRQPVAATSLQPEWHVDAGFITEDDVKVVVVVTL